MVVAPGPLGFCMRYFFVFGMLTFLHSITAVAFSLALPFGSMQSCALRGFLWQPLYERRVQPPKKPPARSELEPVDSSARGQPDSKKPVARI